MSKRKNDDILDIFTPPPAQRKISLIRLLNVLAKDKLNKQNANVIEQRQQIIDIIKQKLFFTNESVNQNTPLMLAIYTHETEISIELIKSGLSNPEQANNRGETALILACKGSLKIIANELIKTNNYNPQQVDYKDNTALILACENYFSDIAIEIIKTGNSNPEQVNYDGNTALIFACQNGLTAVAIELIKTGHSNPEHVNEVGYTALLHACSIGLNNVAIQLIKTGKSYPEYSDYDGWTALMYSCEHEYIDIALELIHSGHSNPESISINNDTALTLSCANGLKDVAFELIKTGHSRPEIVNTGGFTALMYAISGNMGDVAIELIKTGKSNPTYINNDGNSALSLAEIKNMTDVVNVLLPFFKETIFIDINQEGFNTILQETNIIKDFLDSNIDNICFMVNNQYYLTTIDYLRKQIKDKTYLKHGCLRAGENKYHETTHDLIGIDYTGDDNINYEITYFSMSSILGLQIFVLKNEIDSIINNKYSSKLYSIMPSGIKLSGIISLGYISGSGGVSADHCQTGKETEVYTIKRASVLCNQSNSSVSNVSSTQQLTNNINIQYKGNIYVFTITSNTNIGDVKLMLLNKLINNRDQLVNSLNFNVKFIYTGKIYTQDDIKLTTLVDPPFGITLQAMITPKTGGKKTKRLKYNKRKTNKYKTKKRKTQKNKRKIYIKQTNK